MTHIYECRILLIDDNPDLLSMLTHMLNKEGFTNLSTASCCREAREILAQNPDLEEQLQTISEAMTEDERAIYDPLESYRTLAGWLKND